MCGIAGWFSEQPIEASARGRLERMGRSIEHRGPDGHGEVLLTHAALAHRRLSIIDVEGGAQPMACAESASHITFNGEIYNHAVLREQLARRGVRFQTRSDTEVVLQIYRHDGIAGLGRLRGMYAFALWDADQGCGVLARDPFGIKPLFVREDEHGLEFGSEAKAIIAGRNESATLDAASLHLLLNFRYLPGDRSLMQGVRQLGPGEVWQWRPAERTQVAQIQPAPVESQSLLDSLDESLAVHFAADVEVGSYLSGGVDTAALVALAVRQGRSDLRTFTLDVGDDPAEAANAAASARILQVANIQDTAAVPVAAALSSLVWHLEVPKVNAYQVAQVARLARRQVKVTLSGLGADELLLGYNLHRWMDRAARIPAAPARWAGDLLAPLAGALGGSPPWREPERAMRVLGALGDWPQVYGLLRNIWDRPALRRAVYGPRMLDATLPDAMDELRGRWPAEANPVAAAAQFEWRNKMVNDLLWQEDRCSMAVGLEVRVPFVDPAMVAAAARLSSAELMPGGVAKGYFRQSLRTVLPPAILDRPKSGFQVSAGPFFETHLGALADAQLNDARLREVGLFNADFVRVVRRAGPSKALRWHYFILYLMLLTHLWVDAFETPAR